MPPQKPAKLVVEESLGEKLEHWYDNNNRWLNIAIAVVLAVVLAYNGYKWMHSRAVAKANAAFGAAVDRLQMAQQQTDEAKKKDELQGAITAAEQVVSEYADRRVGREAQLMIGNAQYELAARAVGQDPALLEKARESFQKYIHMAESSQEKAAGHLAKGNVLENLAFIKNDPQLLNEAIADYKEAQSAAGDTSLGVEAKLATARALAGKKDASALEQAVAILEEVKEKRAVKAADPEKDRKAVKNAAGQPLTEDQVASILTLNKWSQSEQAREELAGLK